MNFKTKESKKAVQFFCGCLAALLFFSVMIWGFQTSWGKVSIKRIKITGDNGSIISSLAYIPDTATNENPAQVVMIFHGRSNQGHSNDTWSLELARRGYVVFSPDLSGGGQSDVNDRKLQAIALTKYVTTLNYIIPDNVTLVGYSAGCRTVADVASALPENVTNVVDVMSPTLLVPITLDETHGDKKFNTCIIKGQADQYNFEFVGDLDACRAKVTEVYGLSELTEYGKDYECPSGTLRYEIATDFALHQTANVSPQTVRYLIKYITDINPITVNNIPQTDMIWGWQQFFSACAAITMMFFLASMINLLMQNSFFASAANAIPAKKPLVGAKNWAMDILFAVVIPALLFIHVSAYGMAFTSEATPLGKILRSTNLNGIMVWLLVIAAIGTVRMKITIGKAKKSGKVFTLGDFALGADGETKIDFTKAGKGLLIGAICAAVTFIWLGAIEGFMGINYQIWNLSTYLPMNPARFIRAIPYMIIIFTVMFVGNMNQRVLPSTGNARRDMWTAVALNTVLTAAALAILLIIQYGGNMAIGTGEAVFKQMTLPGVNGTSVGALDFAFGYCYMMGGTTGVVTYIYRKYGNIWVGVIPAAIFAGLVTTAGFTMVL